MRRLTYANIMSTLAVFLAMGGTTYAVTAAQSPVRVARTNVFASAARFDANGALAAVGVGSSVATCPAGYIALGGGPAALLSPSGTITPQTSAPSVTNNRQWVVSVDNFGDRSQTIPVYVTCGKASALR